MQYFKNIGIPQLQLLKAKSIIRKSDFGAKLKQNTNSNFF